MKKYEFLSEIIPYIQINAWKNHYGIISPIIAQAIVESSWGQSDLASKYFNYFGMKCGKSWTGKSVNLTTREEYTKGIPTIIKDNFRVYDDMREGVMGYFDFIEKPRYSNLRTAKTPREFCQMLKDDGYATSSSYVETLMKTIASNRLNQYDDNTKVLFEVLAGKWGNGKERKEALTHEGFDYEAIQNEINRTDKRDRDYTYMKVLLTKK